MTRDKSDGLPCARNDANVGPLISSGKEFKGAASSTDTPSAPKEHTHDQDPDLWSWQSAFEVPLTHDALLLCMQVRRPLYVNGTQCNINMNSKRRPSRVVYKYVEVPHPAPIATTEAPKFQSLKESLAYRAWADCYQPPTVHFDLPPPIHSATTNSTSSTYSSRSGSTSSLHSSKTSASHGYNTTPAPPPTKPAPPAKKPSTPVSEPSLPAPKKRAYFSSAILTKSKANSDESSPPLAIPSPQSTEALYTTMTATVTTKNGTIVKKHKVVSTHGFHDGKGAVDWSPFRSPGWEYPLHKQFKGKKVLASYPHCQIK